MKKWGFLFLLLIGFGLACIKIEPFFEPRVEIQNYGQNKIDKVGDRKISENIQKKEITKEQIYQGNLLLVNSKYPVHPESIKSDVINLYTYHELTKGYGLLNSKIYLSEDIAHRFFRDDYCCSRRRSSSFLHY